MTRAWALPAGMLAAFAWHIVLRLHGLGLPLLCDEGEYSYAARVWAQGGLPYRDIFSQKPPMIHAIYRLCWALSSSPTAPRYLAILAVFLTSVALLLLTPKRWNPLARLAAPVAYCVLSTTPVGDFGFPANTEVFTVAFTAWAVWAALQEKRSSWWPLASGFLAGAALMTKQTALWPVLAAGFAASWRGGKKFDARAASGFAAGACLVPAFWFLYYWSQGGLAVFWDCAVAGNMRYASVAGWGAAAEQARYFVVVLAPSFLKGSAPAWLLAGYGLGGVQARFENRDELVAAVWLAGGLLASATGLLLFPHYFLQAAPPLCLAAAWGVARLSRKHAWAALAALTLLPAVTQAGLYFHSTRETASKDLLYPNPLLEVEWLGQWLKARTTPDQSIWVFGSEQQFYIYSDRRCTTKHDCVYPLTMFPKDSTLHDAELAALRAARPPFVVYINQPMSTLIGTRLGLEFRNRVRDWLAAEYQPVGFVAVGRAPAPVELVPEKTVDWLVPDRLHVFALRPK